MPGPLNRNRKFFPFVFALLALSAPSAHAQDIAGSWQGTIQGSDNSSRIILNISKSDSGALKADIFDLDNGALRVPVNNLTFDGSTRRFQGRSATGLKLRCQYFTKSKLGRKTSAGHFQSRDLRGLVLSAHAMASRSSWE
jgi:hypothetical protein